MDSQILKDIKNILLETIIYDVFGILILLIIGKASLNTIGGLFAGTLVSAIAFILLAKNVVDLVEKEKGRATLLAISGYALRMGMYAAILIFAAISKSINIFTVAFGLVSISFVIRIQQLIIRLKSRKED